MCGFLLSATRPDAAARAVPLLTSATNAQGSDYARTRREVAEETGLAIVAITAYLGAFDYTSGGGKLSRQHTWSVTVTSAIQVCLTEHDAYT